MTQWTENGLGEAALVRETEATLDVPSVQGFNRGFGGLQNCQEGWVEAGQASHHQTPQHREVPESPRRDRGQPVREDGSPSPPKADAEAKG